jgi:hypothetical protein
MKERQDKLLDYYQTSNNYIPSYINSINDDYHSEDIFKCETSILVSPIVKNSEFYEAFKTSIPFHMKLCCEESKDESSTTEAIESVTIPRTQPFYRLSSSYKPFSIIRCRNITTYVLNKCIFSVLTNPKQTAQEYQLQSFFIFPKDDVYNSSELNEKLIRYQVSSIDLFRFIEGVNDFSNDEKIHEINASFANKKLKNILVGVVLFVLILSILLISIFWDTFLPELEGVSFIIQFLTFILLILVLSFLKIKMFINAYYKIPQLKTYSVLSHKYEKRMKLNEFVDNWNKTVFMPKALLVSIPITIEYIHVVLDPTKEIQVEHHEYFS